MWLEQQSLPVTLECVRGMKCASRFALPHAHVVRTQLQLWRPSTSFCGPWKLCPNRASRHVNVAWTRYATFCAPEAAQLSKPPARFTRSL
jgi:hypothetical protein